MKSGGIVNLIRVFMRKLLNQMKLFWRRYRERAILMVTMILVGALSFEAGLFKGMTRSAEPISIEIPANIDAPAVAGATMEAATPAAVKPVGEASEKLGKCAFIGSRNSTLYHLPTCAVAKRIKPENIVCFADAADAERRGYKPGCLK